MGWLNAQGAEDEDLDEAWVSVDPAGGQPHVPHSCRESLGKVGDLPCIAESAGQRPPHSSRVLRNLLSDDHESSV